MKRRDLLRTRGAAGAWATLGIRPSVEAAEPPPETTTLRLLRTGSICWAAQYVAEELLHDEGFARVTYPNVPGGGGPVSQHLAAGDADISMNFVAPNIIRLELGDPVVFLAGAHVGCFELVGTDRVRLIASAPLPCGPGRHGEHARQGLERLAGFQAQHQFLSTAQRKSGILVDVHPGLLSRVNDLAATTFPRSAWVNNLLLRHI